MNEYILIVEDEAVLYRRMKKILTKEAFAVGPYTPSVKEALEQISLKQPDLVLLDIKLQGDLTGIDLGKILHEKYRIPFIYVTDFDNDIYFTKALETNHEQYLVKTKPRLNASELKRAIYTALKKKETQLEQQHKSASTSEKLGLTALVNYLEDLKSYPQHDLTRKTILFEDIAFFTTDIKFLAANNQEIRKNYIWFLTKNRELFYLKKSLKDILKDLPDYFVRVSDSYIINLKPPIFEGRINNKVLSVVGEKIKLSPSYKKPFKEKLNKLYCE